MCCLKYATAIRYSNTNDMHMKNFSFLSLVALSLGVTLFACSQKQGVTQQSDEEPIHYKDEKHFKNVKQLTFGGNNAEAYWNFAGDKLVFQSDNKNWGLGCDQIFVLDLNKQQDSTKQFLLSIP